jgi:NADH:ubiquinone oxidoreductase subunit E
MTPWASLTGEREHSYLPAAPNPAMSLEFSPQARDKLAALRQRYPTSQPVVLAALHLALKEHGDLRDEVLQLVAATLELPYAHVYGVATFYTMFRVPGGVTTVRVCTNISCMLRGGYAVLRAFEQSLGLKDGQSNAPAVVCGTEYFLDVTPERVPNIVAQLQANPRPEGEVA